MRKSVVSICAASVALLLTQPVSAVNRSWIGVGGPLDWFAPANWSPNGGPTVADLLTLAPASPSTAVVNTNADATSVALNANMTIIIDAGATLNANTFELRGGTVSGQVTTPNLRIATGFAGTGTYLLGGNASGPTSVSIGPVAGSTGNADVLAGMTVIGRMPTSASSLFLSLPSTFTNNGTMTLEAAARTIPGQISVSTSNFTNAGTLDLLGGSTAPVFDANRRTFSGSFTNAATGTTTIAPGVYVESIGGTLTNSGTFAINGRLNANGFLQQGGTLSVASPSGKLTSNDFDLRGGTVSGTVDTSMLRIGSGFAGSGTYVLGGDTTSASSVSISASSGSFGGGNVLAGMTVIARVPSVVGSLFVSLPPMFTNSGTMTLEAAARTTPAQVNISSSSFTNAGTLNLLGGSTSTAANANRHTFNGAFINLSSGSTTIAPGVYMESTSGTITNSGAFAVTGRAFVGTFVQQPGGTLAISAATGSMETSAFELRGGTVTGTVSTGTLRIGSGIAGSGTYLLGGTTFGPSAVTIGPAQGSAVGDVLAGMNVIARVPTSVSSLVMSLPFTFTNKGTMTLEAAARTTPAQISVTTSSFTNAGTLNLLGGSTSAALDANRRTFNVAFTNAAAGTMTVAAGTYMEANSGTLTNAGTFILNGTLNASNVVQQSGTLNVSASTGVLNANTFEYRGGTINGAVSTATLRVISAPAGSGTYLLGGTTNGPASVSIGPALGSSGNGDLLPGMAVIARVPTSVGSLSLSLASTFTNSGTMTLESATRTTPAQVNVSSSSFINAGTLNLVGGSTASVFDANRRTFNGAFMNNASGRVTVASDVLVQSNSGLVTNAGTFALNGAMLASTFAQQAGGTLTIAPLTGSLSANAFELRGGTVSGGTITTATLRVAGGIAGSGAYLLGGTTTGPSSVTIGPVFDAPGNGDLLAGMTVIARAPASVATLIVSTPSTFTNEGTLTLEAAARTTPSQVTITAGSFTNVGTLNLLGGSTAAAPAANRRTFNGSFTNAAGATLNIASGVLFEVFGAFTNDGALSTGGSGAVRLPALPTNNGVIEVREALLIDYTGSSPLAAALAQITATTGGRIVPQTADQLIGYAEASTLPGAPSTFLGQPVDATTLILRSTYGGDTDLNGSVNFDDLLALAKAYGRPGVWVNGDSDYDGGVDFDDLLLLARSYGKSLAADGPAAFAAAGSGSTFTTDFALAVTLVPEPAAAIACAAAATVGLARRRR